MAYYGPGKKRGGAVATAVAAPKQGAPLHIPGPPNGAIAAAGILVGVGVVMKYLTRDPADPMETAEPVPGGMRITGIGVDVKDTNADGLWIYGLIRYGSKSSAWDVTLFPGQELEVHGDPEEYGSPSLYKWHRSRIIPYGANPSDMYATLDRWGAIKLPDDGKRYPPAGILIPPRAPPDRDPLRQVGTNTGVGSRNPNRGVVHPDQTRGVSVNLTGALTAATSVPINPMSPTPEIKVHATQTFTRMINRFFGAGGEVIDFTRCLLGAAGYTYVNSKGQERVIPRDQWQEIFQKQVRLTRSKSEAVGSSQGVIQSSALGPMDRLQGTDAPFKDGFSETKMATCLAMNWVEDYIIATNSKLSSGVMAEMGLTVAGLGLQGQLALVSGELPFEDLLK